MIRKSTEDDLQAILDTINDSAIAYKRVIPPDQWHDPYMTKEELQAEIKDGVRFSCFVLHNEIIGVMGIQDKADVELIRHSYVRTKQRNKGIGTVLLRTLMKESTKPILIGTWKAATWAIDFYEKHGFCVVGEEERNRLAKKYWAIPDRQIQTSVVLIEGKHVGSKHFQQEISP